VGGWGLNICYAAQEESNEFGTSLDVTVFIGSAGWRLCSHENWLFVGGVMRKAGEGEAWD